LGPQVFAQRPVLASYTYWKQTPFLSVIEVIRLKRSLSYSSARPSASSADVRQPLAE
jgi:hypothetical protein